MLSGSYGLQLKTTAYSDKVEWDCDEYAQAIGKKPLGVLETSEHKFQNYAPELKLPYRPLGVQRPALVVDRHNRLLVAYLPNVLPKGVKVSYVSYLGM